MSTRNLKRICVFAGASAGQTLVLTKPIGTGILATAVKRSEPADVTSGGRLAASYDVGDDSFLAGSGTAVLVPEDTPFRARAGA